MGGGAAHLLRALDHGAERNAREHARQRVVVDADQGDLLGHFDAGRDTGLHELACARVRHADDADGLGQAVEPLDLLLHRFVPRGRAGAVAAVDFDFHVVAPHQRAKRVLALLGPAVFHGLGLAETGEAAQARFDQVVVGQLDELEIIGGHVGHAEGIAAFVFVGAAHGHHGNAAARERGGDGRIVEVGDDTVALPVFDAGQAQAEVFFEEQVPRGARAGQVGGDARDDFAIEDLVRVEQQGDPVRLGHRHGCAYATVSVTGLRSTLLAPAKMVKVPGSTTRFISVL